MIYEQSFTSHPGLGNHLHPTCLCAMVRLNHGFAQAFRSGGLRFEYSFRAELRLLYFM